jgi:hypothetical protein
MKSKRRRPRKSKSKNGNGWARKPDQFDDLLWDLYHDASEAKKCLIGLCYDLKGTLRRRGVVNRK